MSIFRRLTGKHGEKAASGAEQLQASGGAKEHSRSAAELAKQGQVGPLFEKLVDGGAALLLEPHEAKQTLIHIAAENGQKAVVKFLLLHPAVLVDQADAHGNTPLLLACLHRRLEVVDLLLRRVRVSVLSVLALTRAPSMPASSTSTSMAAQRCTFWSVINSTIRSRRS